MNMPSKKMIGSKPGKLCKSLYQGSLYDTNPSNALKGGNPSNLPYICIKFDPPKMVTLPETNSNSPSKHAL